MVNSRTTGKNDPGKIKNIYPFLTKFFCRDTFYLSNFNPNSSAKSKYGDFSVVGFGCETSIFFIFNSFCFKITLTSLTYPNSLYKTRIGNISSPQRYKIIYKIETLYPYNILINLINLKISIMIPIPKMTYNNISTATACT